MTTENTDFNSEENTDFQQNTGNSSTSEGLSFERNILSKFSTTNIHHNE